MTFKPYCEECETWHTEKEGHVECEHPWAMQDVETGYQPYCAACGLAWHFVLKNGTAEG